MSNWIITVSNMENTNVSAFKFTGTESEVKEKLCFLASDDNGEEFTINSIEQTGSVEFGNGIQFQLVRVFDNAPFIVYTATEVETMRDARRFGIN